MPALRPTEVGQPSDRPPNIFAAGRPAPAAALSGGDGARPRAGGAPAGLFGAAAAAPAPLPTLARASRRAALARGPVGARCWLLPRLCSARSAARPRSTSWAAPDRPGADTDANVQSAPPSTPAAPRARRPRARSKDSAAAQPRRLNRPRRAPAARAETVRGAKRHRATRAPPPARRVAGRGAARPGAARRSGAACTRAPPHRPPRRSRRRARRARQPLPVAPGSPPGVHVNRDRGGHRVVCR